MEALFHMTPFVAASAVSALFSAVWEGTVLAVCVVLCLRLFPGLSAASRSVVWMSVFLLLVLLQVHPYIGARSPAGNAARPATFQIGIAWSFVIAGVWAALSLLRGAQLIFSAIRLRGLARRAIAVHPDAALRAILQIRIVCGKAGRSAELCSSGEVERPSVFGFFRPRILISPSLLERLTTQELRQVVLHEMEHLRRADDWTNLLQKMALVVFPLNPALLWVERRLCAERELACDDRVLSSSGGRKAYALCLTRLAEHSMLRRSLSLALGAWERQSELVRRVHRILRSPKDSMSGRQTIALTGSVILCMLACALGLARSPQLVGFAPLEPSMTQASILPPANFQEANPRQSGMTAQLVKAVMPDRPLESISTVKPPSPAKPVRRSAAMSGAKRQSPAIQQAWIVTTEWSGSEIAPRLIFTVQQTDRTLPQGTQGLHRTQGDSPSYAAIPLPNGWLIVEI
jgi:beta-lactamase regulating signal transducer with metallopeptidase domain